MDVSFLKIILKLNKINFLENFFLEGVGCSIIRLAERSEHVCGLNSFLEHPVFHSYPPILYKELCVIVREAGSGHDYGESVIWIQRIKI